MLINTGWGRKFNSWEPLTHIADPDLITEYEQMSGRSLGCFATAKEAAKRRAQVSALTIKRPHRQATQFTTTQSIPPVDPSSNACGQPALAREECALAHEEAHATDLSNLVNVQSATNQRL